MTSAAVRSGGASTGGSARRGGRAGGRRTGRSASEGEGAQISNRPRRRTDSVRPDCYRVWLEGTCNLDGGWMFCRDWSIDNRMDAFEMFLVCWLAASVSQK